MSKFTSRYVCQQCGYESIRWLGKCPNCDSWGSLVETVTESSKSTKSKSKRGRSPSNSKPISLNLFVAEDLIEVKLIGFEFEGDLPLFDLDLVDLELSVTVSTKLPHESQLGHLPNQRIDSYPHC